MTFNYNDLDEIHREVKTTTKCNLDVIKSVLGIEIFNAWCNNPQAGYYLSIKNCDRNEIIFEANKIQNYVNLICHTSTNPTRMKKLREGYGVSNVIFCWERCYSNNLRDEYHSQIWAEMNALYGKKNSKY